MLGCVALSKIKKLFLSKIFYANKNIIVSFVLKDA